MIGALILRDLRRALRGGGLWLPLAFLLLIAALFPFAVGPDATLLARTGGGLIWVMQEPQNAFTCAGESSLLPLPLDDPRNPLPAVSLNGLATDLVADPVTGTAIAVRACVGLVLRERVAMPANNLLLVWARSGAA